MLTARLTQSPAPVFDGLLLSLLPWEPGALRLETHAVYKAGFEGIDGSLFRIVVCTSQAERANLMHAIEHAMLVRKCVLPAVGDVFGLPDV